MGFKVDSFMRTRISICLILLGFVFYGNAQGCSDAGFCTLEGLMPQLHKPGKNLKNQIKLGGFYGSADNNISVYGNYVEYGHRLNSKLSFNAKLNALGQSGNDITVFGLADIFLTANYQTSDNLKLILGAKFPLMAADRSFDELPLPMDYQSSLGTSDLIFGLSYQIKKLQITAAIQQPLTQNSNQFLSSDYPESSELASIQSSRDFQRAGDILSRLSYPLQLKPKLKFTPGLLAIYHLTNDRYTNALDQVLEIENSQGLTLNANLYLDYKLSAISWLQLNAGFPFLVREARPDGLTRSMIANLEYRISF